jgi:hypothetical protein
MMEIMLRARLPCVHVTKVAEELRQRVVLGDLVDKMFVVQVYTETTASRTFRNTLADMAKSVARGPR